MAVLFRNANPSILVVRESESEMDGYGFTFLIFEDSHHTGPFAQLLILSQVWKLVLLGQIHIHVAMKNMERNFPRNTTLIGFLFVNVVDITYCKLP